HLTEVEQTCTHVVVMKQGRLIADSTVSELIGSSAGSVYVETGDRERTRTLLQSLAAVTGVATQGDGLVVEMSSGTRADLAAALVGAGIRLETIMPTQRLEDAFLDLLEAGDEMAAVPAEVAT
ncbi:MAG: type transport system ATP-binding protein, partial [Acidimicrobiaceae bacterium]|nr:type transport system ATP-binding protein [Acidimicrobiaceae bacterium]